MTDRGGHVNVETDFPDADSARRLFGNPGRASIGSADYRQFHAGRPVIGIADRTANRGGTGRPELRVPPEQLVELPDGASSYDLVGCTVATDTGEPVGIVAAVEGSFEMSRLRFRRETMKL